MNIAILFSGHLRSYKDTYRNFRSLKKYLIETGHNVKIFCHTWDSYDSNTPTWWKSLKNNTNHIDEIKDVLLKYYEPDRYCVQNSNDIELYEQPVTFKSDISYTGLQFMYESLKRSKWLADDFAIQKNIHFDIYIRTRYDILVDSVQIIDKKLYLPKSLTFDLLGGVGDTFALVPDVFANQYFDILDYFLDNDSNENYFIQKTPFVPELFLAHFLKEKLISYELLVTAVTLLRTNGVIYITNYQKKQLTNKKYLHLLKLLRLKLKLKHYIKRYFKAKTFLVLNSKRKYNKI